MEEEKYVRMPGATVGLLSKMTLCTLCGIKFNRLDNLQRHMKNKHNSFNSNKTMIKMPHRFLTFQNPFFMMVTGPSGSRKGEWARKSVTFLVSTAATRMNLMVFWTMAAPVRRPSEENSVYIIYTRYPRLFQ